MASICLNCGVPLHSTGLGPVCPACLMSQVVVEPGTEPPAAARFFSGYHLLDEIGRGGMASVYRAWDPKLERTVALKMLLAGPFASPELTARFELEMKAVARLSHPGIVALHEAGEHDGIRFFTMDLVDGPPLTELLRGGPLAAGRASAYVRKAALAVEHAHHHQILHRDLKPSNILIDPCDEPKVTDFGLAQLRPTGHEPVPESHAMGSPPYMAPEQIAGDERAIGPATDVYALGAVLYHLLTGRAPHQGANLDEILDHVAHRPVIRPKLLNGAVPLDLETICLKCLEKLPAQRYNTPAELASDLGRFERGEPVHARPLSYWGVAWRWARRNRALATALAALAVLISVGLGEVVGQALHNRAERERLDREAYATGMLSASLAAAQGNFALAHGYLAALTPARRDVDRRGFEWRLLWSMTTSQALRSWHPHTDGVGRVAYAPDGSAIATNSFDGRTAWLPLTGLDPTDDSALGPGAGWALAFLPDGSEYFIGSGGTLRLVDAATRQVRFTTPGWNVSLSRDGTTAAIARGEPVPWEPAEQPVEIWDLRAGQRRLILSGGYRAAALSPDGHRVALAPANDEIRIANADTGAVLAHLPTDAPQAAAAYSPDGRLLATCGLGGAYLWRTSDFTLIARLPHPWLRLWAVAFSPDGSRLATTCSDRAVRLWDTATGRCVQVLRGHMNEVWSVAFSPDGSTLASGDKDGTVMLWPAALSDAPPREYPHRDWSRPAFSSDGLSLLTSENEGGPFALIRRPDEPTLRGPAGWLACGFSDEGSRVLLWSQDAQEPLRWWNPHTRQFEGSFAGAERVKGSLLMQVGLSSDRSVVYQLNDAGELTLWDQAGTCLVRRRPLTRDIGSLRSVALSARGHWFGWSSKFGDTFWLADTATGMVRALAGHHNEVNSVAFSPDGSELASASSDDSVRLWNCESGECTAVLPGHLESVNDVAYSPDGKTLVSLGTLQSVKFWNLATRREVMNLPLPDAGSYVAFSPDGEHLAVTLENPDTGEERAVRILDAPPAANQSGSFQPPPRAL
ncbi:MAG TPA: serine/threonine-protein kinase [Opitutaceae bacterium]|jgi:WD40 repeat protein/tRNA A-37 threonylcarbamoyl transferase component Bud32